MKAIKAIVDEIPMICKNCIIYGNNKNICGEQKIIEFYGVKTLMNVPDKRCCLELNK